MTKNIDLEIRLENLKREMKLSAGNQSAVPCLQIEYDQLIQEISQANQGKNHVDSNINNR